MFDRLIDIVVSFWESLLPFTVIRQFEQGVILRLGRFNRVVGPGFHWVIPFIEAYMKDTVVTRTHWSVEQTARTSDGQLVSIRTIITWHISDVRKALLECDGVDDAIRDTYVAAIGDAVSGNDFESLNSRRFVNKLLKDCQRKAERYGVTVESIHISDLIPCNAAIRLVDGK